MIRDIDLVLELVYGPITVNSSSGHQKRPCNNNIEAELSIGSCKARLTIRRQAKSQTIDFVACEIEDTRPVMMKAKYSDLIGGADGVSHDPLGFALSDLVEAVRTDWEPFVGGEDGRQALAVMLVIL